MKKIKCYQLFLFDLDGLLVDTERFHYEAYVEMGLKYGFCIDWSGHSGLNRLGD